VGAISGRHPLRGQRIAFDLRGTPEEFRGSGNGVNYRVTGIRTQAANPVRRLFRGDKLVGSPAQADVVLALEVAFRLSSTIVGVKCECQTTWVIRRPAAAVPAPVRVPGRRAVPAAREPGPGDHRRRRALAEEGAAV
jgi:hypothetical protein